MERVVVTGIGAVTPLGNSFPDCWDAALNRETGIRPITKFDVSEIPWKMAGELRQFNALRWLTGKEVNRLDPFVHYAIAASAMATEDAGLLNFSSNEYLSAGGVIIGSGRGGIGSIEKTFYKRQRTVIPLRSGSLRPSPYLMPATTISMASSYVAQKLSMKGFILGISNACASGTNAIGEAYRLLRSGYRGPVLAGGTEAPICRICVEGYGVSGALSTTSSSSASRPFDRSRNGFVLAEGACVLVLEHYKNAMKRGAPLYGEIIGYGNTTDAFHITQPDPAGEARALAMAMEEAGIQARDINYINTHGTGTQIGDTAESQALSSTFEDRIQHIPASATKSLTGHMLAASGAFETAATLKTMRDGIIPPTVNLDEKDPSCCLSIITEKMACDIDLALTYSFGFGGINAALILKRL